ncbi:MULTISPECIES: hypothetical protein [unclassified Streptomyces]|uniref:hypothetical protein n=1 Tax=unclassified Streptomyces TaxID=2593676 RepID=UPI002E1804CF|nr:MULTISPECIES: hypothetical protein [unclassified Streptomyces]
MNLREDKWEVIALAGGTLSTIDLVTTYTGWARVFCLVLGLFGISAWCREIRVKRRKRRDLRRAWLTHFDRLMRDEVKHRCR